MTKKQILTVGLIGLLALLVTGILVWLKPAAPARVAQPVAHASTQRSGQPPATPSSLPPSTSDGTLLPTADIALAPSLQDTEIDCALQANPSGQLVLDSAIRRCFEYFLTQTGEKSLAVIDQQIKHTIKNLLPAPAAQQALDLWQRYLNYREAESKLSVSGDKEDPDHLQRVLAAMTALRQQFFNPAELDALFGAEVIYNQYTIDRMQIMDDQRLTATQKAQKLKERFAQLPQDLQKNIQDISKLHELRTLTQEIRQRNGSPAELQQMRIQLVGPEAAARLQQLDQSRADWKTRIEDYLTQRQAILASKQADQDKQRAIAALRERQFASEAERQRAISFEHFKDQGTDISVLLQ